jgi:hypothetical protein
VPPQDPRFRRYRTTLWIVYFLLIAIASVVVVASVVRNLRGPHRPSRTGALPTRAVMRVCVTELDALNQEQNARAWRLGEDVGEGDAIARWQAWSQDWEQRVDDLADRCRLDASVPDPQGFGGREELRRAREAILELHRAYRAQANRFAQEDVSLARQATARLREAQRAVAPRP